MQRISRFRMIVFIVICLAMIGVFSLRLYKTQAVVTEESLVAADADSMTYQTTVEGARGCILDRNGNVLVSNRATYNIVIINYVLANTGAPNENILKLLQMCQQLGIECQSHFPVTKTKPYEYDMQSLNTTWQNYFRMFKKLAGMTGTAKTEEQEFQAIYDHDVVAIPTIKLHSRKDLNDTVYTNQSDEFNVVVNEIAKVHKTDRRIIVGPIDS